MQHLLSALTCISGMSGIIYIAITLSAIILPNDPFFDELGSGSTDLRMVEHPYIIYICTRNECTVVNSFVQQFTWGQLLVYILFHIFTALVVPFIIKQVADKIAFNVTQRVANTVRHIRNMMLPEPDQYGSGFFPPHPTRYDSENDSDNETEYIPQYYQFHFHFPHHMAGQLPPIPHREIRLFHEHNVHPVPSGHLVSRHNQIIHRPRQRISYTMLLHMLSFIRIPSLFANTDNDMDSDAADDYKPVPAGIPTVIEPARVRAAAKTFAGETCPICIGKFHLLEIKSKTLAVTDPCNHLFCHACIDEYVNDHPFAQVHCPLCRTVVEELYISK